MALPPHPLAQAASDVADDIVLHSLMSRLVLLCLTFPRLRILWSRSMHATAGKRSATLRCESSALC